MKAAIVFATLSVAAALQHPTIPQNWRGVVNEDEVGVVWARPSFRTTLAMFAGACHTKPKSPAHTEGEYSHTRLHTFPQCV